MNEVNKKSMWLETLRDQVSRDKYDDVAYDLRASIDNDDAQSLLDMADVLLDLMEALPKCVGSNDNDCKNPATYFGEYKDEIELGFCDDCRPADCKYDRLPWRNAIIKALFVVR